MRRVLAGALLCAFFLVSCSESVTDLTTQAMQTFNVPVQASADDAEGKNQTSSDLDLGEKTVALTFRNVPAGSVQNARVQFKAETKAAEAAHLSIKGPGGSVAWVVPAWRAAGHRNADQLTPDLSGIVGNSGGTLSLTITGSGHREALSFNGGSPPVLVLTYEDPTPTPDPTPDPEPEPEPPAPEPEPEPEPEPQPEPSNAVAVTNLNDSGAGSLRACAEGTGERTCVFKVGGAITLAKRLNIVAANSFVTIDGSTAPSPVTLKGSGNDEPLMKINSGAHDVTVRYLRFHKGAGGGQDNLALDGTNGAVYNVVIDHNSFLWATDENINTYRDVDNITFSWNIIAEPLHCSTHEKGCHGKNGAMGKYSTGSQTFRNNLIMSAHDRSLQINQQRGVANYINNVHYNNYDETNLNRADESASYFVNLVGNVWIPGPDSVQGGVNKPCVRTNGPKVYARDNTCDGVNYAGYSGLLTGSYTLSAPVGSLDATSAAQAYTDVLAGAGATLPARDATDTRLLNEVRTRTGGWKNSPPAEEF